MRAAAYGGFNNIHFLENGEIRVEPIIIDGERLGALESRLMMFYTGASRLSSEVAGKVIANLKKKKKVLYQMRELGEKAIEILTSRTDLDDFGKLLNENWNLKKSLSNSISNTKLEKIYNKAIKAGALGGKLPGAGASGFMVF